MKEQISNIKSQSGNQEAGSREAQQASLRAVAMEFRDLINEVGREWQATELDCFDDDEPATHQISKV